MSSLDPAQLQANSARLLKASACILTRMCESNDKLTPPDPTCTLFKSSYKPNLSVYEYLVRCVKHMKCSPSCVVAALIYIDRLLAGNSHVCLNSFTVHRMLLTSLLCAVKFLDDVTFKNNVYSTVGGVALVELNSLELDMLLLMDFNLYISGAEFDQYFVQVSRHLSRSPACTSCGYWAPSLIHSAKRAVFYHNEAYRSHNPLRGLQNAQRPELNRFAFKPRPSRLVTNASSLPSDYCEKTDNTSSVVAKRLKPSLTSYHGTSDTHSPSYSANNLAPEGTLPSIPDSVHVFVSGPPTATVDTLPFESDEETLHLGFVDSDSDSESNSDVLDFSDSDANSNRKEISLSPNYSDRSSDVPECTLEPLEQQSNPSEIGTRFDTVAMIKHESLQRAKTQPVANMHTLASLQSQQQSVCSDDEGQRTARRASLLPVWLGSKETVVVTNHDVVVAPCFASIVSRNGSSTRRLRRAAWSGVAVLNPGFLCV